MCEQHALGPSGGAGGVDLHGDVVVVHGGGSRQRPGGVEPLPLGAADHDVVDAVGHQVGVLGIGEDELHVGIAQDVALSGPQAAWC